MAQTVKNPPAKQETQVWFPGQEDLLEKGMATYSNILGASLVAQMVKNLPANQETWVLSLGWENSLEEEMITNSSIFARRIPWTEEPGGLLSMGSWRVGHDWATNTFTFHLNTSSKQKAQVTNVNLGTDIYLHYNVTRFSRRLVYILIPHSR